MKSSWWPGFSGGHKIDNQHGTNMALSLEVSTEPKSRLHHPSQAVDLTEKYSPHDPKEDSKVVAQIQPVS